MQKKIAVTLVFNALVYGLFSQTFSHQNISLLGRWNDTTLSVSNAEVANRYSGIWGYAANGREYALLGAADGAHIIDVTDAANPVQVAFVKGRRDSCVWREYKTYSHYLYTVSDDWYPNSFQIIDLAPLPDSVHVVYDSTNLFERSHTIFIDGDKLYSGITTRANGNQYAMSVYSLANPEKPVVLRKLEQDYPSLVSQVHDMFVKNDTIYASCGNSGMYVFLLDSMHHFNMLGSLTQYNFSGYNHSSCMVDSGRYLIMMDEVPSGLPGKVIRINSPGDLQPIDTFSTQSKATPHNPFLCVNNRIAVAWYEDGLQVYDFTNPDSAVRSGYFDTHYQTPVDSAKGDYAGAWGAYTELPSGHIIVSDMENGLFVLDADSALGIIHHISVGVGEPVSNTGISIYPNPANNKVFVNAGAEKVLTIEVFDIEGRKVLTPEFSGGQFSIEVLSNGYYLAAVTTSTAIHFAKVLKQ